MRGLIFDIEIIKAIPSRKEPAMPGIEYCGGWDDHANMGISVISAYECDTGRYRVFLEDNFGAFEDLANVYRGRICGFNSINFDDKVCAWNGIHVETTYDLLREVWRGAGLGPEFDARTHADFGLDRLSQANQLTGKTGHGALAPIQWQQGKRGAVIDYCLEDVRLTATLIEQARSKHWGGGWLRDPRTPPPKLNVAVRSPEEVWGD